MARITVDDCLDHVENRFELVVVASKRARQLSLTAAEPGVEPMDDKNTVIALREIAQGLKSLYEEEKARFQSPGSDESI